MAELHSWVAVITPTNRARRCLWLTRSRCPAQNEPGGKVGTELTGLGAGRAAVGDVGRGATYRTND
jgi:hypothetical protein